MDVRTDVYGVGATLYTALAGQAPFDGEDAATALSKLVSEEPPLLAFSGPSLWVPAMELGARGPARDGPGPS